MSIANNCNSDGSGGSAYIGHNRDYVKYSKAPVDKEIVTSFKNSNQRIYDYDSKLLQPTQTPFNTSEEAPSSDDSSIESGSQRAQEDYISQYSEYSCHAEDKGEDNFRS